jgi:acyl-[acyl-carrier-protein]-phospholipid O-acyltransferase/long-chain-fatty-acid--[acyl-carrier-protein] ligase
VVSVPDEKRGETLVVLHNNFHGDVDGLCKKLKESGLPPLWLPDPRRYYKLDEWPTLGTGKADFGKARQIALDLASKEP